MRNIRVVSLYDTSIQGDLPLTATAWDNSNDSVVCAFGPTPTQPVIELKRRIKLDTPEPSNGQISTTKLVPITSWDAPCPLPDLPCDEIVLMHYFPDTLTVCLVLAGGDLMLVREEPGDDQERIEIVGSIDVGIVAAAWAPDEELLAIVTSADYLVLLSRYLDPVTETVMTADDLHMSKHVSVGWGKKETQFQGKRAKAMRDPTVPDRVDEGLPSSHEDGRTMISWRGDGAYLAINAAAVAGQRRAIRVYSREGVLDSVSEPVDGMESAVSWRPAGNLLASIKRSKAEDPFKIEVIFFERNGLRHGEFPLRMKPPENGVTATSISLAWNIDSSVLAVSLNDSVQFWTTGNYHYYLKQEVRVIEPMSRPVGLVWHTEAALKCFLTTQSSLREVEFLSHVSRGSALPPHDYGIVPVIDGSTLKLTPFKHVGVPPPMAFIEVQTDANIVDVAVSRNGQRLALLTLNGICFADWPLRNPDAVEHQKNLRHAADAVSCQMSWSDLAIHPPDGMQFTQVVFQNDVDVFVFAPAQRAAGVFCTRLTLHEQGQPGIDNSKPVSVVENVEMANNVQNLLTDTRQETLWAQSSQETILVDEANVAANPTVRAFKGGQVNSSIFQHQPPPPPPADDVFANGHHPSVHKISLTAKGVLMAAQRILARDCTSYVLTDLHLVYTTSQHLLKFVHLTTPDIMDVPADTPEIDERCRRVERGAKIVTVIPSTYAVVLQMPRGNVETIFPRVLVLRGIRESLRNLEYRSAFLDCQKHQVDLNILYDYLPDVFLANVKKFIDDLKKPSRIDEFLSKLKEENVAETLYRDTLREASAPTLVSPNGKAEPHKVNTICDAFIDVLRNKPSRFLQCIITAHVCKRPADLISALTLVSSLRQTSAEEADLAVSHLCFLTDTNRLYDAALALYDLELTLLVAQNAQRDPREYMPFLQNLQALPLLRRRYQIDNHLHNYAKALASLHAIEAHDEVESYTVRHSLYTHAIDLYKYSPVQLGNITALYAEHLASKSQPASAAILYESLSRYSDAYRLYALAHRWRECLSCASLIPLPPDELRQLAQNLATTCADESRDYRSAATIHIEYLSDPSTAAKLLCKSSYFAEASRVLSLHRLTSEIATTIDVGLGDKFSEILDLVADCKSQLAAQVPRIQELRVKKQEDPLAFYGGDPTLVAGADGAVDIPDNISLAATDASTTGGQSLFTRYGGGGSGASQQHTRFGGTVASNVSRKTSKTKRKEERKRARGKKGSVYEEEYLVASVGRLVEKVNGVHDEVSRLLSGLMRRGMREQAKKVDEVMREIVERCETARTTVWQAPDVGAGVGVTTAAAGIGGDGANTADSGLGQHGSNGHVFGAAAAGAIGTTLGSDNDYRPSGADGVLWDSQQDLAAMATNSKKTLPWVKPWGSSSSGGGGGGDGDKGSGRDVLSLISA